MYLRAYIEGVMSRYCIDPKFLDRQVGQTVQTQIRLPIEEQSDLSLHCLLFHFHHLEVSYNGRSSWFDLKNLRVFTFKFVGVRKIRVFLGTLLTCIRYNFTFLLHASRTKFEKLRGCYILVTVLQWLISACASVSDQHFWSICYRFSTFSIYIKIQESI